MLMFLSIAAIASIVIVLAVWVARAPESLYRTREDDTKRRRRLEWIEERGEFYILWKLITFFRLLWGREIYPYDPDDNDDSRTDEMNRLVLKQDQIIGGKFDYPDDETIPIVKVH